MAWDHFGVSVLRNLMCYQPQLGSGCQGVDLRDRGKRDFATSGERETFSRRTQKSLCPSRFCD